jgi:hypothetical protein
MSMSQGDLLSLKRRFEETGIPLRLAPEPFVRGRWIQIDRGALLMDIRRVKRLPPPGEALLLWPGEAECAVVASDRRRRQIVMRIHERQREFQIRDVGPVGGWYTRVVPERTRLFLIGKDEVHLFLALMPKEPRSVDHAHRILAPDEVLTSRREGRPVPRQGEHFFVPADPAEIAAIRGALEEGRTFAPGTVWPSRQGRPVWRRGKPHRASQCIVVGGRQFVRGVVRHPDHASLRLLEWSKPELNLEGDATLVRGLKWVD